jgi:hypothetical protein
MTVFVIGRLFQAVKVAFAPNNRLDNWVLRAYLNPNSLLEITRRWISLVPS